MTEHNGYSALRCGAHGARLDSLEQRMTAEEARTEALASGDKKTAARLALYNAIVTGIFAVAVAALMLLKKGA